MAFHTLLDILIMHQPLDPAEVANINDYDDEQRYRYFLKAVCEQDQIWILTDDDGCVMLNTEDEDCIPVWPAEVFAIAWASDEWAHCKPKAIALSQWHSRWTPGLIEDDLALAVFPSTEEEGFVIYPDELEAALKHKELKDKH
jgi:hypothetical protein